MSIRDVVERLRLEGYWGELEAALEKMKEDTVSEMRNGEIRTQEDLIKANTRLEVLDEIKNIDNYGRRGGDSS